MQRMILSIRGVQTYMDQEPETIELVTEGTMEFADGGWNLCYQESDLTGLAGVTTTFRLESGVITLDRTGTLHSQMVFQEGVANESLYQMEFGALMLTVCATKVRWELSEEGGFVELVYRLEIENSAAGVIEYHLQVSPKNEII